MNRIWIGGPCLTLGLFIGPLVQWRWAKATPDTPTKEINTTSSSSRTIDLGRLVSTAEDNTIALFEDAATNPGNSGGPLLDSSGKLIGVNTAMYSPPGAYAGIGFSVPVDVVNWVVPDLIEYGEVRRSVLGVDLVQQQIIDRMELKGALVMNITPGSGAEKGGLQPTRRSADGEIIIGDLIVEVNGNPVESNNDLLLTLEKYKPGEQIHLKVKRKEQTTSLTITLGSSL